MFFVFCIIIQYIVISDSLRTDKWWEQEQESLEVLINSIVEEISQKTNECIVFTLDPYYRQLIKYNWNEKKLISYYTIAVRENEEFNPPRRRINAMLINSKNFGCNAYVILIANGLQVIELLQFAERERLLNTRGYFILMYDERIFNPEMKYIWSKIVNVVFIRRFGSLLQRSDQIIRNEWFNLETVTYPLQGNGFVITHYIDTWYKEQFRYGIDHFANKTVDLQKKKLKVAIFEHIPAVTKQSRKLYNDGPEHSTDTLGIEFEIIRIIAEKINFRAEFYRPPNIEIDKWGTSDENGIYNGLLGEAIHTNADFLLGDFHYTLRHYRLMDLSYPYNTECLTFITPEVLTQNSWKLLINPFQLYTWIAIILILFMATYILFLFAQFYQKQIRPFKNRNTNQIMSSVTTAVILKRTEHLTKRSNNIDDQMKGLTLFTEIQNGMLYTYGMLLQVSLPRLPKAWALRLFIGWWWLNSILVTVAYRASMTAILANPVARITIDTLAELVKSSITVGGWGEDKRDLFTSSSDENMNKIGGKFQLDNNETEAIARVADGTFAYYENIYVLREARAKRQLLEAIRKKNSTENNEELTEDRDLHIMTECVIHMPISIGMNRNSPLKPQIDQLVRRIVESGLVAKWLSDVMEWSKIVEVRSESNLPKALMNIHKLYGAFIALGIGYLLGFFALAGEYLYWKYIVTKNPAYDKYQMDIFYATIRQAKK